MANGLTRSTININADTKTICRCKECDEKYKRGEPRDFKRPGQYTVITYNGKELVVSDARLNLLHIPENRQILEDVGIRYEGK